MALHSAFPKSRHAILDPGLRWFPAEEALPESSMEKLMPPLVPSLRRKVQEFRDGGYVGAADTSKSLLNSPHLLPKPYLPSTSGRGAGGEGELLRISSFQHWPAPIDKGPARV